MGPRGRRQRAPSPTRAGRMPGVGLHVRTVGGRVGVRVGVKVGVRVVVVVVVVVVVGVRVRVRASKACSMAPAVSLR